MKKLLLLLSFACVFSFTNAQYTLIPDPNFEQALIDLGHDDVLDGKIMTDSALKVTGLDLANKGIKDLTGVEDFVNISTLYCQGNDLTSLNLSNNTGLIEMYCFDNQIKVLNLMNHDGLFQIYCHNNNLEKLKLGRKLDWLDLSATGNDNLFCIEVPSLDFTPNYEIRLDSHSVLSTSCGGNVIEGFVFEDQNEDGVLNSEEGKIKGAKITLNSGEIAITNKQGKFQLHTDRIGLVNIKAFLPKKLSCDGESYQTGVITFPLEGTRQETIVEYPDTLKNINFGMVFQDTVSCGSVSGIVFDDQNGNGIQDTGEDGLRGVTIEFTPGGYTSTDVNGFYSRTFKEGEDIEVSMVNKKQNYGCEDRLQLAQTFPSSPYSFSVVGDKQNNDFGVQSFAGYDVGLYSIRPFASEIGEKFKVMMDYKSDRSIVTDTCTLSLEHDANAVNISATRPPKKKELNRVEWEFLPGETPNWECMGMVFELDEQQTEKGDEITWEATYFCGSDSSTFEDVCNENNTLKRTIQLSAPNVRSRSSQDLFNSMEVFVDGVSEENITNVDTNFSYVINFRNETRDTIYHLYVFDTLPVYFNIETVSRPFSNFPYKFHITDDRVLVWEMDSIAIPPMSVDPLNSYGFVQFNVIMNQNVAPETAVTNSALIRYNYNGDILPKPTTVYVERTVGFEDDIFQSSSSLLLYPNPTSNWVVLQLPENKSIEQPRVELINTLGQSFESSFRALTTGTYQVETENITSGIYIVNLWNGDALVGSSRLVKQ